MSRIRSKKSKNVQLPLFIEKLIEMLDDSSISNIISWTSTNDSFNIKSITQFTQKILPKYFKHNNFSSFIRQLNMYGFRKTRHEDGQNVYQNENFIKGNKGLLKNIKRKINQEKEDENTRLAVYGGEGQISTYTLSKQVSEMKTRQKDLQSICRHLLMQNQKLIEENNTLMKRMKDESRRKERKIQQLLLTFIATSQLQQNNQAKASITNSQNDHESNNNLKNLLTLMSGTNDKDIERLNDKSQSASMDFIENAFNRNKDMKQFKKMLEGYDINDGFDKEEQIKRPPSKIRSRTTTRTKKASNGNPIEQPEQPFRLHDDESSYNFGNQQSSQHMFEPLSASNFPNIDEPQPQNLQSQNGFISINDFMSLDDPNDINLEESHGGI